MKKFTITFCTLLFTIFISHLTVNATSGIYTIGETIGYVQSVEGNKIHITGEAITAHGYENVIIDTGTAPIYDLETGLSFNLSDVYVGMAVRAAYISVNKEPFEALAIWLNWDNNNAAVFSAMVSENIQNVDDSCVFLSSDGRYRITLSSETIIICPTNGNLSPFDIVPGHEFFVWVDMITASSPAKVFPDKVVLLSE